MKAVNLIPGDSRSRSTRSSRIPFGPTQVFLVLLAVAVGLVTVYVLTSNTIKERQVKVAQLQQEVSQQQAVATRLTNYANFVKLAQNASKPSARSPRRDLTGTRRSGICPASCPPTHRCSR